MQWLALTLCSVTLVAQNASPCRILGRVMDLEGHPIPRAEIILKTSDGRESPSFWSDAQGRFGLQTTSQGYLQLMVKATNHDLVGLPFLQVPGSELNPEFRLPLIPWLEPKSGSIALWGTQDGTPLEGAALTRRADGTWVWEKEAPAGSVVKAGASFPGYVNHPGHNADRYSDGSNFAEYFSKNGRIRFVLDPRKMGKAGERPSLMLPPSQDGFRQAMMKVSRVHGLLKSLYDKGPLSDADVQALVGMLQSEADGASKGLATCYLVGQVTIYGLTQRPLPAELVRRLTADFSYDNYLWETSDLVRNTVIGATANPKATRKAMEEADRRQGGRYSNRFLMSGFLR